MKRNLDGIFLLDKPLGGSSNHALQRVKRLFAASKAGHTGSLDPLATGMLPICFGEATKFSQHLLDANKIYEVTAKLGVRTDTGDAEGKIISQKEHQINLNALIELLPKFTGQIQQIPPMYSALKHKGKPLYEYARNGETIDRPARTVTIFNLALAGVGATGWSPSENTMSLRVHCSKGTYIRSLIDDLGEALGCGAHVTALRRTMVEPFQSYPMITFDELEASTNRDQYLLPMDAALATWPRCVINDEDARKLLQGKIVILDSATLKINIPNCFYDETGRFLGVGVITQDGNVTQRRLVSSRF